MKHGISLRFPGQITVAAFNLSDGAGPDLAAMIWLVASIRAQEGRWPLVEA